MCSQCKIKLSGRCNSKINLHRFLEIIITLYPTFCAYKNLNKKKFAHSRSSFQVDQLFFLPRKYDQQTEDHMSRAKIFLL